MNNNTNSNFSNQQFTWALEDSSAFLKLENQIMNDAEQQPELSDADLFQLLLGNETQQAMFNLDNNVSSNHSTSEDSASVSDDTASQKPKQTRSTNPNKPPASSTIRLDFRPINDHVPESQLKAMTSKERRQLRNKISARNFRNRRKEYVGNLEEDLNQQKAENSQLRLEIKWLKNKIDSMQKENDKLRLDLMLGGIILPPQQQQPQSLSPLVQPQSELQALQQPSPPSIAPVNSNVNINNTMNTSFVVNPNGLVNSTLTVPSYNSSSSSDESNLSSPPNLFTDFPDNWDFVLPAEANNTTNTYISQAVVPNWNVHHLLTKETSNAIQSPNLFQQYPLLAPALMSIVLAHTMTMSTEELLSTAKLAPPSFSNYIKFEKKYPFTDSNITMTQKEAKAVWNLLEPLQFMKERNENALLLNSKEKYETTKDENTIITSQYYDQDEDDASFCPISWLKQSIARYVCEFVTATTTQSYTQPLITEESEEQDKVDEEPLKRKFILCRKFHEAKRYITTSS